MSKDQHDDRFPEEASDLTAAEPHALENFVGMSPTEIAHLVLELETQEIELSIQNHELRQAQHELVNLRDKYADLYDNAPIGYLTINSADIIVLVNRTLATMLGYSRVDLANQPLASFIASQDQETYHLHREAVVGQQSAYGCELRLRKQSGALIWVSLDSVHITGSDPEQNVVRSVISDISQRKEAEAQAARLQGELLQVHKVQAIGELSGGIAHEFNNLLTPILGYVELLLLNKTQNDPDFEHIRLIQNAASRARELIQQLLNYSHLTTTSVEPMRLESCIDEVLAMVKNTIPADISIKVDIASGLPPVLGNSGKLHQVLLNLILNSCQAMTNGGTLSIGLVDAGTMSFTTAGVSSPKRHCLCLSVRDTGVGMTDEQIGRVFDPFYTTKEVGSGTGLGLSLVKGIINQHEGHIDVESEAGEWSVFRIYLPVSPESVELGVKQTVAPSRKSGSILLVDDEPMVISLSENMLEHLGYQVVSCLHGSEAMRCLGEQPAKFDLIVSDFKMPEMNGLELAKRLHEINPDIPILLVTGYGDLISAEEMKAIGISGVLMKPFTLLEIDTMVNQALTRPSK